MNDIIEVTDQTFEAEVIDSDKPTIVDFWAPWCMPCRMMTPILEKIAANNAGRIKVCKLNTDHNQATASHYGIMSIPSLLIFKDGQEVKRTVGVQPPEYLQAELDKIL